MGAESVLVPWYEPMEEYVRQIIGPTGYGCREYVAMPGMNKKIRLGQAYAWNPTIQGTKCEETTYLGECGIETFTRTGEWPRTVVETPYGAFEVADILEKRL